MNPIYREPVSLVTLLPRQLCLATKVHHGDKFPLEFFFPLDVERLAELARRHHYLHLFTVSALFLARTTEFKRVCLQISYLAFWFGKNIFHPAKKAAEN